MNYYWGIDLSLSATGVVILDSGGIVKNTALISTKTKGMQRLHRIKSSMTKLITMYPPYIICVEGYSFGSKGRGIYGIGELGGVIRLYLYEHEHLYRDIAPKVLKKFASGKGNCGKEVVLKEVYKRWHFDVSDNNIADAFVLAKIAWHLENGTDTLTEFQKDCLGKIVCL